MSTITELRCVLGFEIACYENGFALNVANLTGGVSRRIRIDDIMECARARSIEQQVEDIAFLRYHFLWACVVRTEGRQIVVINGGAAFVCDERHEAEYLDPRARGMFGVLSLFDPCDEIIGTDGKLTNIRMPLEEQHYRLLLVVNWMSRHLGSQGCSYPAMLNTGEAQTRLYHAWSGSFVHSSNRDDQHWRRLRRFEDYLSRLTRRFDDPPTEEDACGLWAMINEA